MESPIITADRMPALFWRDYYRGSAAILACGGPSLSTLPPEIFQTRGVITAAINNVAASIVRPHIWFCSDTPERFHPTIWRDPAITKFIQDEHLTCAFGGRKYPKIRRRSDNGKGWQPTKTVPADYPSVWGYHHCATWPGDDFFRSPLPTWGPSDADRDPDKLGPQQTTFLVALWILYYIGIRRLYLAGCDLSMQYENPYCFDPGDVGKKYVVRCNALHRWLSRRLEELRQVAIPTAGMTVELLTQSDSLKGFRYITIDDFYAKERLSDLCCEGLYS